MLAPHREATVVNLDVQLPRLLLFRKLLGPTKRIKQVERHPSFLKGGEIARLPSPHVVLFAIRLQRLKLRIPAKVFHPLRPIPPLAPRLKDPNEADDLQLAVGWDSVPDFWRGHALKG
jgi:hypothetical protein